MKYLNLAPGGKWINAAKNISSKLAIIVPYRNRETNLKAFLTYMHHYLIDQDIDYYVIHVIEPTNQAKFNRALLLNIGYLEALWDEQFDCFIFHDVDMLPEIKENRYECDYNFPKQMAISISIYNYS